MKSLYIAFQQLQEGSGISKKIVAQYEALKKSGLDISFCVPKKVGGDLCYVLNDNELVDNFGKGKLANARTFYRYKQFYSYVIRHNISFIYMRYELNATPFFLNFLSKLKKKGVRIYLEIPTYPYDGERQWCGLKVYFERAIEKYSRKYFKNYIDKIVTFSVDDKIFGISTIRLSNAVDTSKIPLRKIENHKGFNMIAVAMFQFWHGYDRIIRGLHSYYLTNPSIHVHLYIIGRGEILDDYKRIVKELRLDKYVTFCGVLYGSDLDKMFNIADIGIGSLGRHRSHVYQLKTLKNVEYAMRGIPFIYSEVNPDFDRQHYVMKAKADDSEISISDLINFVRNSKMEPIEIRESVVDVLSWESQMKKIHDSLF